MRPFLSLAFLTGALTASSVTPDEAFTFLYSTLSLPDRSDYTEEFYKRNINASFRAKSEMPWGSDVPDREFLHFVLPVRVNNENLDLSREVFYEVLKDRVKGLSMKDAILEVNHWCHEHVTYRPSDGRTSSPLSSMSQAIGRCGEESTFTVAALRSVGIPARQIYTPRWAHTDDNHAWVEAWADGKWHFIGACEPEAVLDLAWFNAPASRGLLMNTNVAGDYDGPEEVLLREPFTTRINVTSNYAPVAPLKVKVVNADGSPSSAAKVNFCIYNYAEYYPAATKLTDSDGTTSLNCGLGDMVVWATDGERFGFSEGSAANRAEGVTVVLDKDTASEIITEFTLTPPPGGGPLPTVTAGQRALNDRRLAYEDSIRNAYTATFATPESASLAARKLGVDTDKLTKILLESRGNHDTILQALATFEPVRRDMAVDLLLNISEKDRRDIPMNVISDHVWNVSGYVAETDQQIFPGEEESDCVKKDLFDRYVLNPRIELEALTPWRSQLKSLFSPQQLAQFHKDPEILAEWVRMNIADASGENPRGFRMSPESVARERRADALSRNIFFVALARTADIPARIDPVTGVPQYIRPGDVMWHTADFSDHHTADSSSSAYGANTGRDSVTGAGNSVDKLVRSTLQLDYKSNDYMVDPKYYSHFTLSRIVDGVPVLLEYPEEATVHELFSTPRQLEPGQYILTTGRRLADGGVLARSEIFSIAPGEASMRDLHIRQAENSLSVIGSLNAENLYHDLGSATDKSLLSTTGRGYYVLALVSPGHEPSAHSLNDISAVGKELEESGNKILVLFDDKERASRFDRSLFPNLPATIVMGVDNDGVSKREIEESLHLASDSSTEASDSPAVSVKDAAYPVIVIADTFNRIVWVSTGYSIGTGERLLTALRSLTTQ